MTPYKNIGGTYLHDLLFTHKGPPHKDTTDFMVLTNQSHKMKAITEEDKYILSLHK
jgi:hypothetical protein